MSCIAVLYFISGICRARRLANQQKYDEALVQCQDNMFRAGLIAAAGMLDSVFVATL